MVIICMPPLPKLQNENALYKAYAIDKMSINQIADKSQELFGTKVSNASVYHALKRMGIETRSISESVSRAKSKLDIDKTFMTEQVIEWVDGFLLGDGRISYKLECEDCNQTARNARFSIGVLHKEFAVYAMSMFKDYHPSEPKQCGAISDKRPHLMWGSVTLSHPDILAQAMRWYQGKGKKTRIPKDVRITPTSIRLWYLGDGSFHYDPIRHCSLLRLATCSFFPEDIDYVLMPKLISLGVKCKRLESKNDLQILPESTGTFFNLIGRKSPIQCYDYKFEVPDWLFKIRLADIVKNEQEKWKAVYHIRKGDIQCSSSPGGKMFVFDDDQATKLRMLLDNN